MARIDGNISDLFFNTYHAFNKDEGYTNLQEEAQDFLDCLDRLGIDTPTTADLIHDFENRI